MNDPLLDSAENADCRQLRSWTRYPPDMPQATVLMDGASCSAAVLNESFGGIGLAIEMTEPFALEVGKPVTVLCNGYPTPGRVQWIQLDAEAKRIRLGIRWSS